MIWTVGPLNWARTTDMGVMSRSGPRVLDLPSLTWDHVSVDQPSVAIIMTAVRAAGSIPGALNSIEAQDYSGDIDVVIAAGDEESAAAARDNGARVIMNPSQITPTGLNLALAESNGEVIVRVDAQSRIPPDYVTKAVAVLQESGAESIGGMQIPIGMTFWEKAIAASMSSRFGAGASRHRVGGERGPTDTVYLGVFHRETLDRLGGYNENFVRNQDYELNFRIRDSGGVVWFDPSLKVQYRPRGSLASLINQYFNYGRWKRYFSRTHPGNLVARQLAAPALVVGLILTIALGFFWPLVWWIPAGYAAALLGAGMLSIGDWGLPALGMPLTLAVMHLSWGLGFLRGHTRRHSMTRMRTRFLVSVGLTDLAVLVVAELYASMVVFGVLAPWNSEIGAAVFPMLGFIAVSMVVSSVLTVHMSGPGVPRPAHGRMFAIFFLTAALTAVSLVLVRDAYFSRLFLVLTGASWLVLAITHRTIRRRRPWTERIGVITNEKQLADNLADSSHADVVWVLDPAFDGPLGLPDRDIHLAVDLRAILSDRVAQYLSSCDVAGYSIRPFMQTYEDHTGRVPLVHLAEGWEISAPFLEVAPWLPGKRIFDTLATAITAPLWVLLGIFVGTYIKLASPGPVILKQKRIGLDGQPFTMYKFRTMSLGAESDGSRFVKEDERRSISGGRRLRNSRINEIPQLWNVLKGNMSLVGPRAERVPFVRTSRKQIPFYEHRHMVRPGVTGWAQVNHGYVDDHADTVEKLTYDLYYIKHMSPVMDLRVLWKSMWTVLTGAGAR